MSGGQSSGVSFSITEPSERGHDYPHISDVEKTGERGTNLLQVTAETLELYALLHVVSWPKVGAK